MSGTQPLHEIDSGLPPLGEAEFQALCALVRERTGIHLGADKVKLLQGRLGKRLRALGLGSFREYLTYLHVPAHAPEFEFFSNVVTTNKTSFFREPHHFEFLSNEWLAEHRRQVDAGAPRRIRIWSAGCSSGEEPYTIAVSLLTALGSSALSFDTRILASDINTSVLNTARRGVYEADKVSTVPESMLRRWFLRGTGDKEGLVCVRKEARELVTFREINFADTVWPIHTKFDVIFCRNALIYFDRATQERIVRQFLQVLAPDGYLILGHSECIHGWVAELTPQGRTVYRYRPRSEARESLKS